MTVTTLSPWAVRSLGSGTPATLTQSPQAHMSNPSHFHPLFPSNSLPPGLVITHPLASKNKMAIILEVRTLGHILLTASLGDGTDPVDAGKGNMGKGENWKGAKEGECNDPD